MDQLGELPNLSQKKVKYYAESCDSECDPQTDASTSVGAR